MLFVSPQSYGPPQQARFHAAGRLRVCGRPYLAGDADQFFVEVSSLQAIKRASWRVRRLILRDVGFLVETRAHGDPDNSRALLFGGFQKRREFVFDDKLRSEKVLTDEKHGNIRRRQSPFDFIFPLGAGYDLGVVPKADRAVPHKRHQRGLKALEPFLIFMAVADKHLIATLLRHGLPLWRRIVPSIVNWLQATPITNRCEQVGRNTIDKASDAD